MLFLSILIVWIIADVLIFSLAGLFFIGEVIYSLCDALIYLCKHLFSSSP